MKCLRLAALLLTLSITPAAQAQPAQPIAHAAATCADCPNQAAAQRAADTRDADSDGIYCESLPCPCLKPGQGSPAPTPQPRNERRGRSSCSLPRTVVDLVFSATRCPNIRRHFLDALRHGWPRILVINRPGADARRDRLRGSGTSLAERAHPEAAVQRLTAQLEVIRSPSISAP